MWEIECVRCGNNFDAKLRTTKFCSFLCETRASDSKFFIWGFLMIFAGVLVKASYYFLWEIGTDFIIWSSLWFDLILSDVFILTGLLTIIIRIFSIIYRIISRMVQAIV